MMLDTEMNKLLQDALENEKNVVRTVCHNYMKELLHDEKLQSVVIFHLENFVRNIFDLALTRSLIKYDQFPSPEVKETQR